MKISSSDRVTPAYQKARRSIVGSGRNGFVLVTVLWVVLLMFLLGVALDNYVSDQLEMAAESRQRLIDQIDQVSTEQALLYMLATHRQTRAGLVLRTELPGAHLLGGELNLAAVGGELKMNGTPYRGFGRILFSLQDESGLISLNTDNPALIALFKYHGLADARLDLSLDRLRDYRDYDSLRRLNGAEKFDYEQLQIPPPSDDFLRSPNEYQRIAGWPDLLRDIGISNLPMWTTDIREPQLNFNTMPVDLVMKVADKPLELLNARRVESFWNAEQIRSYLNQNVFWPDEQFRFFPNEKLRVQLWREGSLQRLIIGLELAPRDLRNPVHERYRYTIQTDADSEAPEPGADSFFEQFRPLPEL